jgi:hypothetical protein
MKLNWLYDCAKWPECIPVYRLGNNQHFHFSWLHEAGFDTHIAPMTKEYVVNSDAKILCYPVESRQKDT